MVSVLFIRSFKRANALYDAMESRCYDGTIHVLNETFPPEKKHILSIAVFEIVETIERSHFDFWTVTANVSKRDGGQFSGKLVALPL